MSKLEVDTIAPQSGTQITIGESGDTVTIPTGVTLDASNATTTLPANVVTTDGTQTLTNKTIDASQLSGTVATSNLGTGTADATTFLRGDQTYASATPAAGSITTTQLAYNPNPFRNIIINGDMSIAQRGTSVSSITTSNYYTVDRFNMAITTLGTWTQSQSTDVPSGQGFAKSFKIECTTADASPASGDVLQIQQKFEGQNLQYLKYGTANASSLTLSFWVKSNKTGTYVASFYNNDNARHISKSYTIDTADTWEKKTITYAGDTVGALDNDNAVSLLLILYMGAGTDFTSGTLATSWNSYVAANACVGQVNLADSTSNYINITGVQLEAGTTASDFEFLPYDVNLQRCLRYYELLGSGTNYPLFNAYYLNPSAIYTVAPTKVTMRTNPSLVQTTGSSYYRFIRDSANDFFDSISIDISKTNYVELFNSTEASGTGGVAGFIRLNNASSYLAFNSEL